LKRLSEKAMSTLRKLAAVGAEEQLCRKIEGGELMVWARIRAVLENLFGGRRGGSEIE
jgi:hypothetical protein